MTSNDAGSEMRETRFEFWGARVGLLAAFALAAGWVEALVFWAVQQ